MNLAHPNDIDLAHQVVNSGFGSLLLKLCFSGVSFLFVSTGLDVAHI